MNIVILTQVKVQSINDVAIPDKSSNTLRGDEIRLVNIYVCGVTQNEILETILSREELHYDAFILEGGIEISADESEYILKRFHMIELSMFYN